jgi:type II secretory ATPase GspE/PulE/Tfp pilus assembly ATPase PilB-like protein
MASRSPHRDPAKLAKDTQMPPVVRLVNLILRGAAKSGASDIHMEPKENYLQVRYRIDGLLREVIKVPRNQLDAAISRMKIISGMDIADLSSAVIGILAQRLVRSLVLPAAARSLKIEKMGLLDS